MHAAISPYELQPLTPGAAAALTLCEAVTTLLPGPEAPDVTQAREHAPRFRQLLDAWSWTTPLWRSTVLRPSFNAQSPLSDIRETCQRIVGTPALSALAPLISACRFENPDAYLDLVCRDILRGGADPSISIPLAAGIERFAARHQLLLFTTPAASVSGRLESRAARPLFKLQLPLLAVPSATAFDYLRSTLSAPIATLRRIIDALPAHLSSAGAVPPAALQSLDDAQASYTTAFQGALEPLTIIARKSDREAKVGLFASLTCVALDPDASLFAAARAAQAISTPKTAPPLTGAPDALARPRSLAIHVRPLPWDLPRVP